MKTINLTAEQMVLSLQQLTLIARHGIMESDIQHPFGRVVHEIQKRNALRGFEAHRNFKIGDIKFQISTGIFYDHKRGFIVRHVYHPWEDFENFRDGAPKSEEDFFIANIVLYIARLMNPFFLGIRSLHHVFDKNGQLYYRCDNVEKRLSPKEVEAYIWGKLSKVKDLLHAEHLPSCDESVTGKESKNCILACPARLHCQQRRKFFNKT